MTPREETARAITFFENAGDMPLLRKSLEEAAPRIKRMVSSYLQKGSEETIPHPADVRGAREEATREEAMQTLRKTQDFALLQAITRAIGQRIETLEIAASADFPPGVRVTVPEKRTYPRSGGELPGTIEESGTTLVVRLDNGDTWEGPASLARLGAAS
ncbi:MAG: hypothetical protein IT300_03580 [Dehalococcoidia bacterium]|nr:hypothetical protein [Dehalococcoidia bacterium]